MITYLPQIGYMDSASRLSNKALAKQCDTALLIATILDDPDLPGQDHPAVRMWRGHERQLISYGLAMCHDLRITRKIDTDAWIQLGKLATELREAKYDNSVPPWHKDLWIHRSHRSELVRRYPKRHKDDWPNTPQNMPILWPQIVSSDRRGYRLRLSEGDIGLLSIGDRVLPSELYYDKNKREVIVDE
jgi:Pyrimidine dimer DNA glycosylase